MRKNIFCLKFKLSESKEHQIRETFCDACVEFHYPNNITEFGTILELLKDSKNDVYVDDNDDLGIGE